MADRPAVYDLTHAQLTALVTGWGEPAFRADQIWRWLYKSLASDYAAMGNLPSELRMRLSTETRLGLVVPAAHEASGTGQTRKVLFRLHDGNAIESVLMCYHDRRTACISVQAGCGMGCTFCATGQGGLARNLSAGEILAQVIHFARETREAELQQAQESGRRAALDAHPITNIVFMGMGEPLANYEATWQAIETLTDARGYGLGARRITVSTVGLVPGILRLASEAKPVNLAVSLHAADDELRNELVPVNLRYPLEDLLAAVRDYAIKTGRRVTIEYALIAGINDAPHQARQLAVLLDGLLCHVNLIPLNPTLGSPLHPSPRVRVDAFHAELVEAGIPTTVRMRRGIDIEAGCGQLRQRQTGIAAG
jgi:23S rRNA (adenine2503-C2)-methyltransferase